MLGKKWVTSYFKWTKLGHNLAGTQFGHVGAQSGKTGLKLVAFGIKLAKLRLKEAKES